MARPLCFSCDKNKQKYITGLCEDCHQLVMHPFGRPPAGATDVKRFTGARWVDDDRLPGVAFVGTVYRSDMGSIPYAWYGPCTCDTVVNESTLDSCPGEKAVNYALARYSCVNRRPLKVTHDQG